MEARVNAGCLDRHLLKLTTGKGIAVVGAEGVEDAIKVGCGHDLSPVRWWVLLFQWDHYAILGGACQQLF
jgi:hypothetical protein